MTVSLTSTFELQIDQVLRRAFQVAGMYEVSQTPSADDLALGRDLLGMELDALVNEGVILQFHERTTQAIEVHTGAEYTLDTDAVDVAIDTSNVAGVVTLDTDPTVGTPVRAISRQEYENITDKTTDGRPTLVYIERAASLTAIFWPVPDDSYTFSYIKIRLPRDPDATTTLDLGRRWQKAIVWSMAWQLAAAKSKPEGFWRSRKTVADEEKRKALSGDQERPHVQMYVKSNR